MDRFILSMRFLRWLGLPLGCIMYIFTVNSFGDTIATVLGALAGVAFCILIDNERIRLIGEIIEKDIDDAINESFNIEHYVQIKRMRRAVIARIYIVNARERVVNIHSMVNRKLEDNAFRKYLWIMQMADIPGKDAIEASEEMLDEQLINELLKKKNQKKKQKK